MENINTLRTIWIDGPDSRLSSWRTFRQENKNTELHELCSRVALWWSAAPVCSISIDPYEISSWPDAWELLHAGEICKFSAALGIAYTIHYIKSDEDVIIMRVFDSDKDDIYNATLINNSLLLASSNGQAVDFESVAHNLKIEEQWHIGDIVEAIKNKS